jgi:peptidoglycan DL-endopeptidase CwlO
VQALATAMQAAQRARRSAESRAAEAARLSKDLKKKKSKIEGLFNKTNDKVMRAAIDHAAATGEIPELGNIGSGKAAGALKAAMSKLGKPYVWGATGPNAYDCSGLLLRAYEAAGVTIPRVSRDQFRAGAMLPVEEAAPGDFLFWAHDTSNPATIHHVAMYLGDGEIVEAQQSGVPVHTRDVSFDEGGMMSVAVRPGA